MNPSPYASCPTTGRDAERAVSHQTIVMPGQTTRLCGCLTAWTVLRTPAAFSRAACSMDMRSQQSAPRAHARMQRRPHQPIPRKCRSSVPCSVCCAGAHGRRTGAGVCTADREALCKYQFCNGPSHLQPPADRRAPRPTGPATGGTVRRRFMPRSARLVAVAHGSVGARSTSRAGPWPAVALTRRTTSRTCGWAATRACASTPATGAHLPVWPAGMYGGRVPAFDLPAGTGTLLLPGLCPARSTEAVPVTPGPRLSPAP